MCAPGGRIQPRAALTLWLAVAVGTAIAPAGTRGQSSANPTEAFQRMVDAYAAGDHDVVARTLTSEAAFTAMLPAYDAAVGRWQAAWRRNRTSWARHYPAFALEVGAVATRQSWKMSGTLVNLAGRFVVQRPDRIGDLPDDDAFEVLIHRAAVALMQQMRSPDAVEGYARHYQDRISPDPSSVFTRRIVDPRFLLSYAIAGDLRARQSAVYLAAAASRYRDAARFDVNAAEATVRLAWVQHRRGQSAEGLALLDTVGSMTADAELLYLGWLFRGRLLAALGRHDEAAGAYERALATWPRAQAPAVALSALHLLSGRPDLGATWAATARTQMAGTIDPWWQYWIGEGRFAATRLDEVRQALPRPTGDSDGPVRTAR